MSRCSFSLFLLMKRSELPQEEVLEQQQLEREDDSFHHGCMFCSEEFTGNRCRAENGPI